MRAVPIAVASVVVLCAVLAGAPQDPVQQQPQQQPVFRREANYVYVDAYVRKGGKIVEGLTAADFEVTEDRKPQKVETFEFIRVQPSPVDALRIDPSSQDEGNRLAEDPHNRVFVVYLDSFHTSPEGAKRAWPALTEFLRRYMSPTDLFGVLTPSTPPANLVFARRLESAESMLSQYWAWAIGSTPRMSLEEQDLWRCYLPNEALAERVIALQRLDKLFSGIEETIARLGILRDERKNLLLVSDGWKAPGPAKDLLNSGTGAVPRIGAPGGRIGIGSNQPRDRDHARCDAELGRLSQIDFAQRQMRMAEHANRANVSFYPMMGSISEWPVGMAAFDNSAFGTLRRLAEDTDGRVAINQLREDLAQIADDLSAFYLMGYYSTNTATDGRFRKIQVKVNKKDKDMVVTARRGYMAPTMTAAAAEAAAKAAAAKMTNAGPPAAIVEAMKPLARLSSPPEVFTYGVASASELSLVVELPSSLPSMSIWRQGADVEVSLANLAPTKGRIDAPARSATLRIPLEPGTAGPWRLAVTLSTKGERIEDHATIDVPSKGPLLGGPILYRAGASPRAPLFPVAELLFRRTERIHVEWLIRQPLEDRQVRVLSKNGQVVAAGATVTERDAAGQSMLAVDLTLAPLAAGDYVIEVTARRGTDNERVFAPFRVVQ